MIKFKESSLLKLDDYLNLYNKIFQTNKKKLIMTGYTPKTLWVIL